MTIIADRTSQIENLTERQEAVLELLKEHRTSKEIGRELGIAPNTVDNHIKAACAKLGVGDRASAARAYARLGLIRGESTAQFSPLETLKETPLSETRESALKPVFTLSDAGMFDGNWVEKAEPARVPGALENREKIARFATIVKIALMLAAVVAVVIASMNGLNDLI